MFVVPAEVEDAGAVFGVNSPGKLPFEASRLVAVAGSNESRELDDRGGSNGSEERDK